MAYVFFVRPVVIHVVDWREVPQPFVLTVRTDGFFGDQPIEARLFTPPAFDPDTHAKAAEHKEFSSLRKEQEVRTTVDGDYTVISVIALNPWGIVVLKPKGK